MLPQKLYTIKKQKINHLKFRKPCEWDEPTNSPPPNCCPIDPCCVQDPCCVRQRLYSLIKNIIK